MTPSGHDDWPALSSLLDEALDLPADQRTAWLAGQRAKDPQLAVKLEELLEREGRLEAEDFLGGGQAPELPPVTSLAGQTLGAYVLERPLGQGGMGAVWLARRIDGRYEGVVAIKFLSLAVAGPAGEARFRREGSVLARLTHPNIARLLDAGVTPAGQPYLVLEHVDGKPLDVWCDERRLPVEDRLRVFLQVLSAVAHAHANFIVHRDIKPANILVTGDGTVKLLDFGIAKLLEEGGETRTALTGSNEAVLTFEYAAPEQLRGDPTTTATDVYSLGVVLYQLLSGRHPTGSECNTPAEHIVAVLDTDPGQLSRAVAPSAALPAEQARQLAAARDATPERLQRIYAGDLDNILAKALRKAPAERYPTAPSLADDLSRYLAHEPVSARPDAWSYRAGKFLRRHRGPVAATALVALALLGAALTTSLQAREARRQRDEAVREVKRQHAMNAVQQVMASDSRGTDGRQLTGSERVTLALGVLRRQFRDEPWLVAEVMVDLSGRFYESGDRDMQRSILADAERLANEAALPAQLALAACYRVYSFAYDDVFDSAHAELTTARGAMARAGTVPEEVKLLCLTAEGELMVEEGNPDSAIALLTIAAERAEADTAVGGLLASSRMQLHNDLAQALRAGGRTREANRYQRAIVAELDSAGYADTDILPNVLSFLISSYGELGELAAAESTVVGVVRQQEAIHGAGHPGTMMAFFLGLSHLRLGNLDSADTWLGRVARDTTEGAGALAAWYVTALTQLRLDQHRVSDARRSLPTVPRDGHTREATAATLDARVLWEQHDSAGASRSLEANLRRLFGTGPKPPPDLVIPLITAGEWRLAENDGRAADSLARLAISGAAVDSLALSRSGLVGRAELLRAKALEAEGDSLGARAAAHRAVVALTNGMGPTNRRTIEAKALSEALGD